MTASKHAWVPSHSTLHAYWSGHSMVASMQLVAPLHRTSQAKPGGQLMVMLAHWPAPQSMRQVSPPGQSVHTDGHWPPGGVTCCPQVPPPIEAPVLACVAPPPPPVLAC